MTPQLLPRLLAFLAGFQILLVELCAGRFINLYLGPSLYTWTSLIGVVLGGVSIGNFLGGALAERGPVRRTLGEACVLCSVLIIAVLHMSSLLGMAVTAGGHLSWGWRVFLVIFGLLFVPGIAMGLISPLAARWALSLAPERPGETLGNMAALGTWGAIMGTFLTGFVLIGQMGTGPLLLTCASLTGLMGMYLLGASQIRFGQLAYGLVIAGMLWVWPFPGRVEYIREAYRRTLNTHVNEQVVALDESDYFTIRVAEQVERTDEGHRILQLVLDQMVHGFLVVGAPTRFEYSYEHIYSWATRRWAERAEAARPAPFVPRAFYIGGGSYSFPRWFLGLYPQADQLVSEIDPRVTEMVYAQLELPRDTPIRTVADDARRVIMVQPEGSWDLIYGDAFNGFSVPYHLTTRECVEEIRRILAPGGVYMMNLIDVIEPGRPATSRFAGSMFRTLEAVFGPGHVTAYVDGDPAELHAPTRSTFILVATTDDLDLSDLGNPARDLPPNATQGMLPITHLTGEYLAAMQSEALVLTDDFVPLEQLLAVVSSTVQHDDDRKEGK